MIPDIAWAAKAIQWPNVPIDPHN